MAFFLKIIKKHIYWFLLFYIYKKYIKKKALKNMSLNNLMVEIQRGPLSSPNPIHFRLSDRTANTLQNWAPRLGPTCIWKLHTSRRYWSLLTHRCDHQDISWIWTVQIHGGPHQLGVDNPMAPSLITNHMLITGKLKLILGPLVNVNPTCEPWVQHE